MMGLGCAHFIPNILGNLVHGREVMDVDGRFGLQVVLNLIKHLLSDREIAETQIKIALVPGMEKSKSF